MNTSYFYNIRVGIIGVIFLVSCSNDDDLDTITNAEEYSYHTIKMCLDISKTEFYDDSFKTRAISNDWVDGDVLYFRFSTDNGIVIGNATYNDKQGDWTVNYYGALNSASTVEVTHFASLPLADGDIVQLSNNTAVYQDLQATYTYSNKILKVSASLKPITSRIRFKGNESDWIGIGGLAYYSTFEINSGTFTTDSCFAWLKVNTNLYTDYVYGVCADNNNRQIKINCVGDDGWDYLFTVNCTADMMQVGKSGWMDCPTTSKHNGWTKKQVNGEANGHLWIDLGLPSGTKWANENIGADIALWQDDGNTSHIYGGFFYQNEIYWSDAGLYSWRNNDAPWKVPTLEQVQELINNCIWTYEDNYLGSSVRGQLVEGVTGEQIFIPTYGFWTDTPASDTEIYILILYTNSSGYNISTRGKDSFCTHIRAVII